MLVSLIPSAAKSTGWAFAANTPQFKGTLHTNMAPGSGACATMACTGREKRVSGNTPNTTTAVELVEAR
ncbi:hypothetical protein FVEN_g13199 [Fusarium venenatum]|nr:hypothetical protein FVEN_g13199 [Fusarium venenatum]